MRALTWISLLAAGCSSSTTRASEPATAGEEPFVDEAVVAAQEPSEPAWEFEGSAAAEDEAGVTRCYDVQIVSVAADRSPEDAHRYSQQLGAETVASFAGATPVDGTCRRAYPDALPVGVCVHDALLESVQMRTRRHYYRPDADDELADPPRVRCEREGGLWTEP
ncbi:MAG: hypothetical protein R3B82_21570 [Sandaracinaceae bacterium]